MDDPLISLGPLAIDPGKPMGSGYTIFYEKTETHFVQERYLFQANFDQSSFVLIQNSFENLFKRMDFLGHEIEFQSGGLSEEEFSKIAGEFLTPEHINHNELIENIIKIYPFIKNKERISSEMFSTIFNCEIEVAQEAIGKLIKDRDSSPEALDG